MYLPTVAHSPRRRYLEILIEQIAAELSQASESHHYTFEAYSQGWIIEVKKIQRNTTNVIKTFRIFGYHFPLNEAAAAEICTDKAACAAILAANHVDCVPHTLFIRPSLTAYSPAEGIFSSLLDHANALGYPLVAKIKNGNGGANVFFIATPRELEKAAISFFSHGNDICLCPYYDIIEEYRVIILEDEVQLCFSKKRPFLVGDGIQPIASLLGKFLNHKGRKKINILEAQGWNRDFSTILQPGERLHLNWKHNLGQGSTPLLVEKHEEVFSLAKKAAKAVGLCFGSVDIIKTQEAVATYRVLEINAGVMLENFIANFQKSNKGYKKALEIYKKALSSYLKEL
jgi:glutathione synthase/RimK-type ligase-like ATP-grasp enzyme